MSNLKTSQTLGLFRVMRNHPLGIRHWANELHKRRIPSLFGVEETHLDNDPALIRDLLAKGFDFECSHPEPFWETPYQSQYEIISRLKQKFESITATPMRVFSSKFSAFNAETLKVAEKLGIPYLTTRGNTGLQAHIFKPLEFNVIVISASSLPIDQGGGMLVDGTVWAAGGRPEDFKKVLFNQNEDKITLTAQAQLSGVKLLWWQVYQDFLDTGTVKWVKVDEFAAGPQVLPYARIPRDPQSQNLKPQPKIPLEQEIDFPFDR